jgi:hypothetical protein
MEGKLMDVAGDRDDEPSDRVVEVLLTAGLLLLIGARLVVSNGWFPWPIAVGLTAVLFGAIVLMLVLRVARAEGVTRWQMFRRGFARKRPSER